MKDQFKYQLKFLRNLLIAFGGISFLLISASIFSETYNVFSPDIDTYYAKDFDEKKFSEMECGIDTNAVKNLIGNPLSKTLDNSRVIWSYSGDGKCIWFDFAWKGRDVIFNENGLVIETYKGIHYD